MATREVTADVLKAAFSACGGAVDSEDVARQAPVDTKSILDEIRNRSGTHEPEDVIALFRRCVALSSVLAELGVADALGIEDGDPIPDFVFEIAAVLPVRETKDRSRPVAYYFQKQKFLAAVHAARAG